jgi:hypothetical protein
MIDTNKTFIFMKRKLSLLALCCFAFVACEYIDGLDDNSLNPGQRLDDAGYEWVDLGLSVKWATCNVGADSPEDYGDHFAWGEVSPKKSYLVSNSLTYGVELGDIAGNPQYDAAAANWGGDWCMPTTEEQEELRNNCTWEWVSLNGVNGMHVIGPNGNSIFLPAAGYRLGELSYDAGSYGAYWSSTPNNNCEDGTIAAYDFYYYSEYCEWYWDDRYYGYSIRPVLK